MNSSETGCMYSILKQLCVYIPGRDNDENNTF